MRLLRFFLVSRYLLAGCLVFLAVGCVRGCGRDPAERIGRAVRLSSGPWIEEQARFHPTEARLLAVRLVKDEKDGHTPGGWNRRIVQVDFEDENYPETEEIRTLRGGSYPSYAGADIVALDVEGRLVRLKNGSGEPLPIPVEGLATRPTKPVASPDGRRLAVLAVAERPPDDAPESGIVAIARHGVYVLPVEGGKARRVSPDLSNSALVVDFSWADAENLLVTYQMIDRNSAQIRIERIRVSDGDSRLALFTDHPEGVALASSGRFFVAYPHEDSRLVYTSLDRKLEYPVELLAEIRDVRLSADGRFAVASRRSGEEGVNLVLISTPPEFFRNLESRLAPVPEDAP